MPPTQNQTPKPTPPPMPKISIPTIQMKPGGDIKHNLMKVLISLVIVLIVVGGAYALWGNMKKSPVSKNNFSSEKVLLEDNGKSIPKGLPKDLPIDQKEITQSATLNYTERGSILYSISLDSSKQAEDLYAIYGKYFKDSKYMIMNQTKSSSVMSYRATKDNTELNIILTPQPPRTLVQISYVIKNK